MSICTIGNSLGFELQLCSVGLALQKIQLPWGVSPIVGFNTEDEYLNNPCYHGVIVGRVTNRIANAELKIGSEQYKLTANEGNHHLHGGLQSLSNVHWQLEKEENKLVATYTSVDGESGYPGEVKINASFSFIDNRLVIKYEATSADITPLSLTHHPYFSFGSDFGDLKMNIFSNEYLEMDEQLIATGKILKANTFLVKNGIDNCYVYANANSGYHKNAEIIHEKLKTKITIWSNYPAFQIYTSANQLENVNVPIGAACVCVEPQYMTGFTEHPHLKGFYFDGKNKYEKTICYEFDEL